LFRPAADYLGRIRARPAEELEALSRECGQLPENRLFAIQPVPRPPISNPPVTR